MEVEKPHTTHYGTVFCFFWDKFILEILCCYVIHNNTSTFIFYCFNIFMSKNWIWKHFISLHLLSFFVLLVFLFLPSRWKTFCVNAYKWNISCSYVDSLYMCIWLLVLYLFSQIEGGFTREEGNRKMMSFWKKKNFNGLLK